MSREMDERRIQECRAIVAREEKLARTAPSEEAAELHRQKAALYRSELASLLRAGVEPPRTERPLQALEARWR